MTVKMTPNFDVTNRILDEDWSNKKTENKKSKSEQLLDNIQQHGYDLEYISPILKSTGNILINSSAGSGKTTTLLLKVLYDFVSGRMIETNDQGIPCFLPVWVGTFLKSGQQDLSKQLRLKSKLLNGVDLSTKVHVNTLHSEFYQVCQLLGYSVTIIEDKDNRNFFSRAMRDNGFRYGKQEMDTAYANSINQRGSLNILPEYQGVFKDWKRMRFEQGMVDFEDLQEIIYRLAVIESRPEVRDILSNRYRRIYLDEFQDVSRIQYEILKVYALGKGSAKDSGSIVEDRESGSVIAIGDDDQSIYSWRGADVSFLTKKYPADFNATVYQNPKNYRTPEGILSAVVPCIEKNEDRYDKPLEAAHTGGIVRLGRMPDFTGMSNTLVDLVKEDVMRGRSVAVLVRVNSDGVIPAMALANKGISFSLSSKEMTLNGAIGNNAQGILDLANDGSGVLAVNALGSLLKDNTIADCFKKYLRQSRGIGLWDIADDDYIYSLNKRDALRFIGWKNTYNDTFGSSKVLMSILDWLLSDIGSGSNISAWNLRRRAVYLAIKNIVVGCGQDAKIQDVSRVFNNVRDNLSSHFENSKKGYSSSVDIASIHEYKGREAQSVYVWNASRGVFPHQRALDEGGKDAMEEERRIFYIACTRAKEIETIFSLDGRDSPFLKEMDLNKAKNVQEVSQVSGSLGVFSNKEEDFSVDSIVTGW